MAPEDTQRKAWKEKKVDARIGGPEETTTAHGFLAKERTVNGRTMTYVEAARRGKDDWWRYLLGIVLVVFLWLGVGAC